MNFIKIDGIQDAYPEKIEGTGEWYCCKIAANTFCDLYEAEEIVKNGNVYEGMNCVLIHYPDGQVYYPFVAKENVYVEAPVYCDGMLYFLVADFTEQMLRIVAFHTEDLEQKVVFELALDEVPSCYNLRLDVAPVMLLCEKEILHGQRKETVIEVLYPEKKIFPISAHEGLDFRDGDKVYFSEWFEEETPAYRYYEQVVVRDWETGEEIDRFEGQLHRMPNGDIWRM